MKRLTFTAIVALGAALAVAWWTGARSAAAGRADGAPRSAKPATPALAPASVVEPAPSAVTPQPPPTPQSPYQAVPDLTQTDPELELPGGGNSYCGPVAISNSLMRLAAGPCPRLLPEGNSLKQQQILLVRRLSNNQFMGTSPTHGTGGIGILRGLHRYLEWNGCAYRRLAYQGWRGHPAQFSTGVKNPDLKWIRDALEAGGAAWINVGWYQQSENGRAYRRNGGHWLTVVGAGVAADGTPAPRSLVLHDPAPYAGPDYADEYAHAEVIDEGWLIEGRDAFPARGYYRLSGGMHVKREGETAILDGAITLRL